MFHHFKHDNYRRVCDLGIKMKLSKVQIAAYELIQSDARFLYVLTKTMNKLAQDA